LGAILAVIVMYFRKLNPFSPKKDSLAKKSTWEMWFKVVIACVPAAVVGLPFEDTLDKYFYNFPTVAATLIIYGIAFIILESSKRSAPKINDVSEMSYKTALFIGLIQLLSLIPGTSRSGVTILGAMLLGCSRAVAAEFSFFLGIPTMLGAGALKVAKFAAGGNTLTGREVPVLVVGTLTAFLTSLVVIRFLMDLVRRHSFVGFGIYRILLGAAVLVMTIFL
jgi:undecaprenyl-diphosphatase